jgi:uncharacterized protein (TIGR00251 family)
MASSEPWAWLRRDGADLVLRLKVQPRASGDAFGDVQQDCLRVRITAPPVDGKANAHLVAWLARQFGVARRQVVIEQGESARLKRIRVCSPARLPAVIAGA